MRFSWRWLVCVVVLPVLSLSAAEAEKARVKALKVTVLSTMLADGDELGEWGFAALVEVDGHRILFDTGASTDVVLKNARSLNIDLSTVPEVILSHWHSDHVAGFMALRDSVRNKAPTALARTHVGEGMFASRVNMPPNVEQNTMLRMKPDYEAGGGIFVVHAKPAQIHPGVWLTGPVPRKHPERNWSGKMQVRAASGSGPAELLREDTLIEDMSLVIDTEQGLVVITGCGHAGVINIVEHARSTIRPARLHALIGGIHLFNASEATLTWTAEKLRAVGVDNFIGAHCTGIETVYRFRGDLGLDRAHCVVGAVGGGFELGKGIDARWIAK